MSVSVQPLTKRDATRVKRHGMRLLRDTYVPPGTHIGFGITYQQSQYSIAVWQDARCLCGAFIDTRSCPVTSPYDGGKEVTENALPHDTREGPWTSRYVEGEYLTTPREFTCQECSRKFIPEFKIIPLTEQTNRSQMRDLAQTWTPVSSEDTHERRQAMRVFRIYKTLKFPIGLAVAIAIFWIMFVVADGEDNGQGLIAYALVFVWFIIYFFLTRVVFRRWLNAYLGNRGVWLEPIPPTLSTDHLKINREPTKMFNDDNPHNPWLAAAQNNAVTITEIPQPDEPT